MNLTFEKATILARSVENLHDHAKQQFDRLSRAVSRGSNDMTLQRMTPERIRDRLAAHKKDIEATELLLSELRDEIVALSEAQPTPPARAGNGHAARQ